MAVSNQISANLPYLRRYARALTGSQLSGDAFVRATLEAALSDNDLRDQISTGRPALYSAFTRIWTTGYVDEPALHNFGGAKERAAQERLAALTPAHRQALLLTTVEEFSHEEAGSILGLTTPDVDALVAQAIREIDGQTAVDVLIIEDEPLISMQLEGLVADLGHNVCGTAATHKQALERFRDHPAGLILADIQLADGSSGIDAVEDLLKIGNVPVIFITAYPERLLTGDRPEPTYLVTKPFLEETVKAVIGQIIFFGSHDVNI